jgi:probable F420-dependent oxidoreductase
MTITVGFQIAPQYGDLQRMRATWLEAERLGADRIYVADHFFAQEWNQTDADSSPQARTTSNDKNFESTTVQAAMAATTRRAEIGCICHAVGYRNPDLLADIARTIDHISGGRFILGIGAGYLQRDYDEYGYPYGTQKSRLLDLAAALPRIKARLGRLIPPPTRRIPLLIPSMGEKVGLRIVAEHADIWHAFGQIDAVLQKQAALRRICGEIGRDYAEIEQLCHVMPSVVAEVTPDVVVDTFGMKHVIVVARGPDWDLGPLRELIAWRDRRNSTRS